MDEGKPMSYQEMFEALPEEKKTEINQLIFKESLQKSITSADRITETASATEYMIMTRYPDAEIVASEVKSLCDQADKDKYSAIVTAYYFGLGMGLAVSSGMIKGQQIRKMD